MSYHLLGSAIKAVIQLANDNKLNYALIGGLAVSFRTLERATKDLDFVFAVQNDSEAEAIVRLFKVLGFKPVTLLENKNTKAISTVRLLSDKYSGIYLDLLFGVTGIESEIISLSDLIELLPGLEVKVASHSALIAMKILSSNNVRRQQDLIDLQNLIQEANDTQLAEARRLIGLIVERGFSGGVDLISKYEQICAANKE